VPQRDEIHKFVRLPLTVRLAVVAWVTLLVGVGVRVAVSHPWSQSVVPIYLHAGQQWRAGADIYAPTMIHDVYRNPPHVAAIFAPLTHLPDKVAGLLWRGVSAAVFLLGLWAFTQHVLPPLSPAQTGLLFLIAMPIALLSVNNGQANILLTGAVLFGAAEAARGRLWPSAAWLSLAAWLKVYPLAAGLLLCVLYPRLSWRLAIALSIGFALPFLTQDPNYVLGEYSRFLQYVGAEDRTYSYLSQVPRDWTMVPRMWLGIVSPPPVTKGVSVAAGLLIAGLTWLAVRRQRLAQALPTVVGLGLVWMTLFGPATENPTYALLAPVAAAAVASWRGWNAVAAWVAVGLLLAVVLRGLFPTSEVLPLRTAQPIAAALLLVGLLWSCYQATGPHRTQITAPAWSEESVAGRGLFRPVSPSASPARPGYP
jgi:hypothetical protein